MSWFKDNKKLLHFGAELEKIKEYENAAKVYLAYVKRAAKISDHEDSLEILYGYNVYDNAISSYSQAMNCAAVALAAKELILLAKNKFAKGDTWHVVQREQQNETVFSFFEWLGKPRVVELGHFETLTRVKRELEENDTISLNIATSAARYGFADVVSDVVLGNIRVFNKGLVR